jgi:hypothetical protein
MVWLMLSSFIFVSCQIIMIHVEVDLLRETDLGGGSKVLWIIGLIVLPVMTAIACIIAGGKGVAVRPRASLRRSRSESR